MAPYEAAASQFTSARSAAPSGPGTVSAAPAFFVAPVSLPGMGARITTPDLTAPIGVASPAPAAGSTAAKIILAQPGTAAAIAGPTAAHNIIAQPAAAAASQTAEASAGISAALQPLGDISRSQPGQARETGGLVQEILMGHRGQNHAGVFPAASAAQPGFGKPSGLSYANPAGRNSIGEAAEAYFGDGPQTPIPPAPPQGPQGGGSQNNGPEKTPLLPKLMTAALAILPALYLGWPLIMTGATLAGLLTVAASFGVAILPFMSERTPLALRAAPGAVIAVLGLTTLAAGLAPLSWATLAMGTWVSLAGWGFVRFARKGAGQYDSAKEVIASFFGALGATAGAGLALMSFSGWIPTALTILAYPASAALLTHLPGWVGASINAAFRGASVTTRDVHNVASSLRRDTVLRKRIENYSRASVKRSAWNAVWLGLLVWLPIALVETVQFVVGVAAGLTIGVARAPLMLFWGASHELKKDSAVAKFFAGWARAAFWATKVGQFNRFEAPLIPYANSKSKIVGVLASIAIRFVQLGWLVVAAVSVPAAYLGGWISGLKEAGKPYDAARHDPNALSLGHDPLPSQVPDEGQPKATAALPSKLLAAAIGLAPLYILGLPLLSGGFLGYLAAATVLSVALMPVMPSSSGFSAMLRRGPGTLLAVTGGWAAFGAARIMLVAGLPTWPIIGLGALALFSGLGLRSLIDKLQDKTTPTYRLDDAVYIGGFVSALAVTAGLGAALIGLTGALATGLTVAAYVLSPLLLYHLPKYLWTGVGTAFMGLGKGVKSVFAVMNFWTRDTEFNDNLNSFYRHWTKKSFWYGTFFLVPWLLTAVAYLAEAAVSLGLGLAVGIIHAPTLFFWGAAYEKNPDGKAARFWAGFNKFLLKTQEGSKESSFDPLAKRLIGAMNDKDAVSSRPTVKAMAAFLGARFLQFYWLVRLAVLAALTPALWIIGAVRGVQNASGPKAKPADDFRDPDRPFSR